MIDQRKLAAASLACALGAGLLDCSGDMTLASIPPRGDAGVGTTGAPPQAASGPSGGTTGISRPTIGNSTGGRASSATTTGGVGSASSSSSGGTTGGTASLPPWSTRSLSVYGSAQGIDEMPVIAAQPDEANNLWLVTNEALYLLRPGAVTFERYTDADGLHIGLSQPPGITAVAGGAPNQCFVGYEGDETDPNIDDPPNDPPTMTDQGKFDRVDLQPDGSLAVTRFNVEAASGYWENRSVRRFLYDHDHHPGNLYVGMNHGIDRVVGDSYVDHVHPTVCLGEPCSTRGATEMVGEWRGLALDAAGDLWMAGQYTEGELGWTSNLDAWIDNSANPFIVAFGDPYPPWAPVFEPPSEGSSVDIRAVAVDPSGVVWSASGYEWNEPNAQGETTDPEYGIASYTPVTGFTYYDPIALGFGTKNLVDMVALPDGRLVFGTYANGLRLWNPSTGAVQELTTAEGLPGDYIQLMYLDTRNGPPTIFVGTDGGLAVVQP
jgi:hypothetical protein